MDTRIGYPNEHLAGDTEESISSPMYATAVGLLMKGLRDKKKVYEMSQNSPIDQSDKEDESEQENQEESNKEVVKKPLFERWSDKFKEFLDNAE